MDINLNNKVAVITGGTAGIGLATARLNNHVGVKIFAPLLGFGLAVFTATTTSLSSSKNTVCAAEQLECR